MKIKTNYHYYPIMNLSDLPAQWQKRAKREFDWDENLADNNCLFIYRGEIYHIENFTWNDAQNPWQGQKIPELWEYYANDSYFSGVMFRLAHNEYGELLEDAQGNLLIQVATYYA